MDRRAPLPRAAAGHQWPTPSPACMQVECPSVTPEVVLKASGHVERFTDFMVTDMGNGSCHRAHFLLEAELERHLRNKAKPMTPDQIKVGIAGGAGHLPDPGPAAAFQPAQHNQISSPIPQF